MVVLLLARCAGCCGGFAASRKPWACFGTPEGGMRVQTALCSEAGNNMRSPRWRDAMGSLALAAEVDRASTTQPNPCLSKATVPVTVA